MMLCNFCDILNQFVYSPEELPTDDVSKQQLLLPTSVILRLDLKKWYISAIHDLSLTYFIVWSSVVTGTLERRERGIEVKIATTKRWTDKTHTYSIRLCEEVWSGKKMWNPSLKLLRKTTSWVEKLVRVHGQWLHEQM